MPLQKVLQNTLPKLHFKKIHCYSKIMNGYEEEVYNFSNVTTEK